ncbi:hypothetical protein [Pseudalkalibacillus caeni]|uniref:Uncharacterized protein n=1 Tax=Exobacillus caeni TaxID=2574798 RepID=A0A5R9F271_9BACL|nr:hypothetical protein [Pseudalkalibacillus caeni]TLS37752.1 hypothetical protein FCL54_07990 [Pseudalkalibacillus caeni]
MNYPIRLPESFLYFKEKSDKQFERSVKSYIKKNHDELEYQYTEGMIAICKRKKNYVHKYRNWDKKKKK